MSTSAESEHAGGAGMDTHTFTLLLTGHDGLTDELERAIFEAGCDDALLGVEDGQLFLNFDRESRTIDHAIATAMRDVESTGMVQVTAILPPDHVAIGKFNAYVKLRNESSLPELKEALSDVLPKIISSTT